MARAATRGVASSTIAAIPLANKEYYARACLRGVPGLPGYLHHPPTGDPDGAIILAVITAVAALGDAVMILTGGRQLIMDAIAKEAGLPEGLLTEEDLDLAAGFSGTSLSDLESTFQTRAYVALVCGVLVLLLGILIRKAAVWTRVLITIMSLVTIGITGVILTDGSTAGLAALSMLAIVAAITTIVLTWLPANGRYAKAVA